eukprot:sb/3474840/
MFTFQTNCLILKLGWALFFLKAVKIRFAFDTQNLSDGDHPGLEILGSLKLRLISKSLVLYLSISVYVGLVLIKICTPAPLLYCLAAPTRSESTESKWDLVAPGRPMRIGWGPIGSGQCSDRVAQQRSSAARQP